MNKKNEPSSSSTNFIIDVWLVSSSLSLLLLLLFLCQVSHARMHSRFFANLILNRNIYTHIDNVRVVFFLFLHGTSHFSFEAPFFYLVLSLCFVVFFGAILFCVRLFFYYSLHCAYYVIAKNACVYMIVHLQ